MGSVMDVLAVHPRTCVDCLVKHAESRADVVIRELERHGARMTEARCGTCAALGPVFSIR